MELPYLLIPVEMKYDAEYRKRRFVPTCAQSAGWNVLKVQCMSLVSFSENFGQISLYHNYYLQMQFISKFE